MSVEQDRKPVLLTLVGAFVCVISALAIVQTKHESRELFVELEAESVERDEKNIEWGRLRIEQGAHASPSRIEERATDELGLERPELEDINVIETP